MFDNSKNSHDEETSFSEAYKSQILNPSEEEDKKSSLPKILGIIVLMLLISGLSIFGYNYVNNDKNKPKATPQEEIALPESSMMIDHIDDLEEEPAKKDDNKSLAISTNTDEKNIENTANQVKIELSKELDKENKINPIKNNQKVISTSTQKGEDTYLEQLAELSKEIDGEEK